MRRVLIITFMGLFFVAIFQTIGLNLPIWLNLFFLPPVILTFSLQFFKPLEVIIANLICGYIVDVLGGYLIGSNMLLMLVMAFFLGVFNLTAGRLYRQELTGYVICISFMYRILLLMSQLLLVGSEINIFIGQILLGPFIDGFVSIIFYYLLVKIMALVKVFDQNDFFRNRIGLNR
jgi:hypothetical protein